MPIISQCNWKYVRKTNLKYKSTHKEEDNSFEIYFSGVVKVCCADYEENGNDCTGK